MTYRTRLCLPSVAYLLITGALFAQVPAHRLSKSTLAQLHQQESVRVSLAEQRLATNLQSLGLTEENTLKHRSSILDETGSLHSRFDQFYKGVRVWGAQVISHQNLENIFQPVTGGQQSVNNLAVSPTLESGEAIAIAAKELAPKGAFSAPPQAELVVFPLEGHVETRIFTKEGEELNAMEYQRFVGGHTLAYHVHTELENDADGMVHRDYIIQAHTGKILKDWSSLQAADAPVKGTGKSAFNGVNGAAGDVILDTAQGATFSLVDLTRPSRTHPILGFTGNQVFDKDTNTLYTDSDNAWGDGANYSGTLPMSENGQTAAVDGAFGTQATWDFYRNIFNRNGIDNYGSAVQTRVHATSASDNANWNLGCFCMTYGDITSGTQKGRAMTALDVAGHEMSHGVNSFTASLIYSDESGGLNEGNSDILGKMVEIYTRAANSTGSIVPSLPDASTAPTGASGVIWTIGAQLGDTPMRYFYKPSLDGHSLDAWTWSMGATKDVHYTSGPINRMFYFLSAGAIKGNATYGTTLLPDGMVGIGNDKAVRIWYKALSEQFTPMTNYVDARRGCLQAATQLYGAGGPEVVAVHNAFAGIAVGVYAASPDLVAPVIDGVSISGTSALLGVNATMTDNMAVAKFEVWVDDLRIATYTLPAGTSAASFKLNSNDLANGNHSLVLKAFDAAGNLGASTPVAFSVTNDTQQLLVNNTFESGDYAYTGQLNYESSGWGKQPYLQANFNYAKGGNYSMYPCGWAANFLFQVTYSHPSADGMFVIPTGPGATLSFWMYQRGTNATEQAWLAAYLVDEGWNTLEEFDIPNNPGLNAKYFQYSMPISDASKGKKARLVYFIDHKGSIVGSVQNYSLFNIDNVALTVPSSLKTPASGKWSVLELANLAANYGRTSAQQVWDATMDINKDGKVDENDALLMFSAPTPGATNPIRSNTKSNSMMFAPKTQARN